MSFFAVFKYSNPYVNTVLPGSPTITKSSFEPMSQLLYQGKEIQTFVKQTFGNQIFATNLRQMKIQTLFFL
jgi:hypothetical protein